MVGAIKQPNGLYSIHDLWNEKGQTYKLRDKLRIMGGIWNPKSKSWDMVKTPLN